MIYICCSYSEYATRNQRISSTVITSPPNLGDLSPPIVTLTPGFSRPPVRPPPLGLPQLAEWTSPAPCARAFPAGVRCSIAFGWGPTPARKTVLFPASEKQISHVLGSKQNLPSSIQLHRLARPRARWYQLRGLPLVGSECVCLQRNSSFVITRGTAMPSAIDLPVHISIAQKKRQ